MLRDDNALYTSALLREPDSSPVSFIRSERLYDPEPPIPEKFHSFTGHLLKKENNTWIYARGDKILKVTDCRYSKTIHEFAENEARFLYNLRGSEHVIWMFDFEITDDYVFLVLEEEHSLYNHLVAHQVSITDICALGISLCEAVQQCMEKDIYYTDINVGNIYVINHSVRKIKLGDFNSAFPKSFQEGMKQTLGTVAFMAPEVYNNAEKRYGEAAQIYSIGALVYYILNAGIIPFLSPKNSEIDCVRMRMQGEPLPLPQYLLRYKEISAPLVNWLNKALAYKKKQRFSSLLEAKNALSAVLATLYLNNADALMVMVNFGDPERTVPAVSLL